MMKLVAILLPALIDLLNRKVKDSDARFWISVGVCAVVGLAIDYFDGGVLTIDSASESILATFGIAQLVFKGVWEKSQMREDLKLT